MIAARSSIRTGCSNQIDGNVIQTVSRTLIEELKFDRSHGDQPRLGELSDPAFPDVPEIVYRPDRPAERAPVGRRRARGRGGAVGDLERGVRRDRRAAALGALHAGQGEGGDEGSRVIGRMTSVWGLSHTR